MFATAVIRHIGQVLHLGLSLVLQRCNARLKVLSGGSMGLIFVWVARQFCKFCLYFSFGNSASLRLFLGYSGEM
jgi:hypothetical protein